MQMVAFKAAGGVPDITPPLAPSNLVATATGNTSINLTWTAATDNVGVTGYRVERCQGAGCTTFAQVATPAGITFADSGLTAGTSYSYRVRATDAAANLGPYSNTASATTTSVDMTPPLAPSNLVATASGNTSINLTWTAATDNVGVTGYRVERCQGAGCTHLRPGRERRPGSPLPTPASPPAPATAIACGRPTRRPISVRIRTRRARPRRRWT